MWNGCCGLKKLTPKIRRVLVVLASRQGLALETHALRSWWNRPPEEVEGWFEIRPNSTFWWEGQNWFKKELILSMIEDGLVQIVDGHLLALTHEGSEALKYSRKGKGNKGGLRDRTIRHDRNVKGQKEFQHW